MAARDVKSVSYAESIGKRYISTLCVSDVSAFMRMKSTLVSDARKRD
jgi:hypothetical protein